VIRGVHAERALNRFIAKADSNTAYDAFQRTRIFLQFKSKLTGAFATQVQGIADGLGTINNFSVIRDLQPLTDAQKTNLRQWIGTELKPMSTLMDLNDDVMPLLLGGFIASVKGQYSRMGITKAVTTTDSGGITGHGDAVPEHQAAIEAALAKGDYQTISNIIAGMSDSDPYKMSMLSLFAGKLPPPQNDSPPPASNSESGFISFNWGTDFNLTNEYYINTLKDQGNYLLQLSTLDNTTADEVANTIANLADQGYTVDEIGDELASAYEHISDDRGFMIARTELANAMGQGNLAAMTENGVATKIWVAAGPADDEACAGNVEDGPIPVDEAFSSGDMSEPAHPNCECYTDAGEIDLDNIDVWSGV
jgi:hypothetical protein